MPYATIHDAQIFFTDDGEGMPLVFVHGWACDSQDWSWQLPALGHYRVVAADTRGHGRSSAPPQGYEVPALANDVIGLMDTLDIPQAVLIGHSVGGVIVSQVAAAFPDRVAAVIVIDPPYGYDDEAARNNLDFVTAMEEADAGEAAANLFGFLESADTAPALSTWHRRRALGMPHHVALEVARGMHGSMDAIANWEATVRLLTARRMPVLAINITAEKTAWEQSLFQHAHSRSVHLAGAGHWVHQERADEVNQLIKDWISGLDLPTPSDDRDRSKGKVVIE